MNVGNLDRRILIEYPVISQDDYGAAVTSWAAFATSWANVQDVLPSRREAVMQGLAMVAGQTRVRFRYRIGISAAMRITIRGPVDRVLQIVSAPAELGRKEFIEVVCESYSS